MVESQKGVASTADSQKKSSLLDEDFGKDFLSSWKSISVAENDGMDFSCETGPKGKKKSFNFDKLDMDFALDGDFGKISSFKVDMPDLDFSSPAKKNEKPKEGSSNESVDGKHKAKQDCFAFTFDFNELDNFDLDSTLMRREKKFDKCRDDKGSDSSFSHEKNQVSGSNSVSSTDVSEKIDANNKLQSEKATISKFETLVEDLVTSAAPSTCVNFGNLNMSCGVAISSDKNITINAQDTDQHSQQSERTSTKEPDAQTIQNSSFRSVSAEGSIEENVAEAQAEVCSSDPEVNNNPCGDQDGSFKLVTRSEPNLVSSYKPLPTIQSTGMERTATNFGKKLEVEEHVTLGSKSMDEIVEGELDIGISSITSLSQKMLPDKVTRDNKNSVSQFHLAPVQIEPRVDKSMQMKEQGSSSIDLKVFNRSVEIESQLHSKQTKFVPLSDNKMGTECHGPIGRQEFNSNDAQLGNQIVGTSKSHDVTLTKVIPIIQESEKHDKDPNASNSQIHQASIPEPAPKSSILKSIDPKLLISKEPVRNSKFIPVERNRLSPMKFGKTTSNITSSKLKVLRNMTSKNDLSISTPQKEIKALKHSQESIELQAKAAVKAVQSIGSEKQTLLSASLKRKAIEASNADPVNLYPLKRMTESSGEIRRHLKASRKDDEKPIGKTENLVNSCTKDISYNHLNSTIDVCQEACLTELIPVVLENDGNVEKAEACTKELEDICRMLKKKHEEAKELLVRALVNNNNLLMLNHPIYDEKISFHLYTYSSFGIIFT
uniref:Uncharacterized protein n=1 Tax=Nelumbo nucifera TaxID=4432 RepID=A0A822XYJ0_NELNU|nr:TPA_asm: hypothetical protein HUJ06_026237 [Nelumbo nucifera]